MRHTFETSEQTKSAVDGHIKAIADEMEISVQALYELLAKNKDPYPRFRHLFRAVARVFPTGARVYLRDLSAVLERERHRARGVTMGTDPIDEIGTRYHELTKTLRKGQSRDEQYAALQGLLDATCAAMDELKDGRIIEESPVLANKRTTSADDFRV